MPATIQLGDIVVDVRQKDIKNVHLSVYPPTGQVRISAPLHMSLDTIRAFALSKLGWIKQAQQRTPELSWGLLLCPFRLPQNLLPAGRSRRIFRRNIRFI